MSYSDDDRIVAAASSAASEAASDAASAASAADSSAAAAAASVATAAQAVHVTITPGLTDTDFTIPTIDVTKSVFSVYVAATGVLVAGAPIVVDSDTLRLSVAPGIVPIVINGIGPAR